MKTLLFLAMPIALGGLLLNCQATPYRKVEIGAEKGQILHLLGNPDQTYRKNGTDRWVYKTKDSAGAPALKEIWFENGRVVYQDSEKTFAKPPAPGAPTSGAFEPVE